MIGSLCLTVPLYLTWTGSPIVRYLAYADRHHGLRVESYLVAAHRGGRAPWSTGMAYYPTKCVRLEKRCEKWGEGD